MSRRNLPLIIALGAVLVIGVALLLWGSLSMGWDPVAMLTSKEAVWCYIVVGLSVAVIAVLLIRDRIKRL